MSNASLSFAPPTSSPFSAFVIPCRTFCFTCVKHTSGCDAAHGCREQECNAIDRCFTCVPGEGGCSPIRTYNRLFVAEHGRISGRHAMKAEIAARGPISCGIDATLALDEYDGAQIYCDGSKISPSAS
jgi:hypothetical protein